MSLISQQRGLKLSNKLVTVRLPEITRNIANILSDMPDIKNTQQNTFFFALRSLAIEKGYDFEAIESEAHRIADESTNGSVKPEEPK